MREVVLILNELYGVEHTRQLTTWLDQQRLRIAHLEQGSVSLTDLNDKAMIDAIKRLNRSVALNAAQLTKHTVMVPALNKRRSDFEAVIRFKSSYFVFLLQSFGEITVNNLSVVREHDTFERTGHDQHVTHRINEKKAFSSICQAYINGTVNSTGLTFSVVLNNSEIDGIRDTHTSSVFNGVDPFTSSEWEDVYKTAVMERLFDEDIFNCLTEHMSRDAIEAYKAVKLYDADRYSPDRNDNIKIYSSYGKHIATTKFRFSADERLNQGKWRPTLKIVSRNNKPEINPSVTELSPLEDIAQDFGGF